MAYTLLDKEYWKSPVNVFTGITWLLLGIVLGIVIGVLI